MKHITLLLLAAACGLLSSCQTPAVENGPRFHSDLPPTHPVDHLQH